MRQPDPVTKAGWAWMTVAAAELVDAFADLTGHERQRGTAAHRITAFTLRWARQQGLPLGGPTMVEDTVADAKRYLEEHPEDVAAFREQHNLGDAP